MNTLNTGGSHPPHPLELLAPAKNLELGKEAINHGADAVYIGANQFGARAAAGNTMADIEALCAHAHKYFARVYLALNTLLFDHELALARTLIDQAWNSGVDALIIQDMGLLEMDLPPIPLFASTQTDNRTPEKVKFLEQSGFSRVILARELGIGAIEKIRRNTRIDLETFVHGALCVSYSGQCYMSAAIGNRSANRGECGQPCRLPWNLRSDQGRVLAENKYLLSLKDMNRGDHLAALAGAGITSFKIEGRLKNINYVKNIVGFYRNRLDQLLGEDARFTQASSGETRLFFPPDPVKTFNRKETDYYLFKSRHPVHSFNTPKSMGEKIGTVKKITPEWVSLVRDHDLQNGDGICFLDKQGQLSGFYVNRVDNEGRLILPGRTSTKKTGLFPGAVLFRNHDQAFLKQMAGRTSERRIPLDMVFFETDQGVGIDARDQDNIQTRILLEIDKQPARDPARAMEVIQKQLGKLGSSIFFMNRLEIQSEPYFFRAKDLNLLRRNLVLAMEEMRANVYAPVQAPVRPESVFYGSTDLDFRANVANHLAEKFYKKRGVITLAPAFELSLPGPLAPVMTTKHCIRYGLGLCAGKKKNQKIELPPPMILENKKARFRVIFNCDCCEMQILKMDDSK
ncbi:MAG: U32 family peptidase [Desulfobacter sp.]|nr:U32 family peptidase [Desulfobacter sp.]